MLFRKNQSKSKIAWGYFCLYSEKGEPGIFHTSQRRRPSSYCTGSIFGAFLLRLACDSNHLSLHLALVALVQLSFASGVRLEVFVMMVYLFLPYLQQLNLRNERRRSIEPSSTVSLIYQWNKQSTVFKKLSEKRSEEAKNLQLKKRDGGSRYEPGK